MKRAAVLLFACFACGQVDQSNNGLAGKWAAAVSDDCIFTLELTPGPDGVEGTGSGSLDCFGKWSVSTLSDHETMRWTFANGETEDFVVRIRPSCGLPVTKMRPDLVHAIDLQPSNPSPGKFATTFSRSGPEPKCSAIFPPSG
jgi:hypothetical protein